MKAKRGKRPGLKARSKNARAKVKKKQPLTTGQKLAKIAEAFAPALGPVMHFVSVNDGAPSEGVKVLVRLVDDSYLTGGVSGGFFTVFNEANNEWLQFAHPERITHWLEIIPPVDVPERPLRVPDMPDKSEEELTHE